jgi:hypothetical protein
MWDTPVPIFEDEDEDELIARFVELSARYPNREPFEICGVIFKNLRDPGMRANQAAMVWSKDLDILERIRQARLNGFDENAITSKEQLQKKINATIEDVTIGAQEKKVRIDGYMAIAKINGWAEGEAGDEAGLGRRPIIVNYALDPRSQNAA